MYLQSNYYGINMNSSPSFHGKGNGGGAWKSFKERISKFLFDAAPDATLKMPKNSKKIEEFLSNPATNRLTVGVTALATQPIIDYHNHKVDKETREVSTCRTIAKIIAGTAVGMLVRSGCVKLTEIMTNEKSISKFGKTLLPKKNLKSLLTSLEKMSKYRNAISTLIALGVMCITNFMLDAPLTLYLTNVFNKKRLEEKAKIEKERLVLNG